MSAALISIQTGWGQTILSDSAAEFSLVQGQDDWTYGYRNFTADGGAANYHPGDDFIEFGPAEIVGVNWDLGGGAPWTMVGTRQVHPNGPNNTNEHWAIRRWTASAANLTGPTLLEVSWFVGADNPGGTGVTGQLHFNGVQKGKVTIAGNNTTGVTTSTFVTADIGDQIDLALTPEGPSGDRADGADGSFTSMVISTVVDTDNDQLADSWEEVYFPGDLSQLSSGGDFDLDGVNDEDEFTNNTNPTLVDTDGDGLEDGWETNDGIFDSGTDTGTNPNNADTDGDSLSDGAEVNGNPATNPNLADSDNDTFSDPQELAYGTDPNSAAETPLTDALADSRSEFSGVDGQNGWRWGYRNYTADGGSNNYDAGADFIPFPVDGTTTRTVTNFWNGTNYDWVNTVDPQNPPWTLLAAEGTHPNGTNNVDEHWTVRRWTASGLGATTPVRVVWHTRKSNTANDGVTGGIHLNGVQVDARTIAGSNTTGFVRYHYLNLNDGDIVDLILSPQGLTNRTDGSDGSANWMTVDTRVPAVPIHSNGKYFIPVDAVDSDSDGLADFWEEEYFPGDLTQLATGGDFDADGLSDEDEQATGTSPVNTDSDGDFVSDGVEIALGSDPCKADSDGDGFGDGQEVATGYDPSDPASNVGTAIGLTANSILDYPAGTNDPQGFNGWTYGYYNISANGVPTDSSSFIQFPTDGTSFFSATNFWDGNNFDMIDAGGVATNPPWTGISPAAAHPSGGATTETHWATMRWEVAESGPFALSYSLRKLGLGGNGTTAVILQNGVPLDEITVGGTDGVGLKSWYLVNATAGDTLEIALSPKGLNGLDVDGNDNSAMQLWIDSMIPANAFQPDGTPFVPGAVLDSLRVLSATYNKGTSQLTVKFTSRANFEYQVEKLTGTNPVTWTPIGPTVSPAPGGESEVIIPGVVDDHAIIHVVELVP